MSAAIRNQLSLSPKLRELAIMAVGVLNKADYAYALDESEPATLRLTESPSDPTIVIFRGDEIRH